MKEKTGRERTAFYFGLFVAFFIALVLVFQLYKPTAQKLTPLERAEVKEYTLSHYRLDMFEASNPEFKLKDNGRYIQLRHDYRVCVKGGQETEIYWYNVYAQTHSNSDDVSYDHTITAYQGQKEVVVSITLSKGADSKVIETFCSKW